MKRQRTNWMFILSVLCMVLTGCQRSYDSTQSERDSSLTGIYSQMEQPSKAKEAIPSESTLKTDAPSETDTEGNIVISPPVAAKDKIIYLTFDDGPGEYTGHLLDVLDTYGVKVTFFVTNVQPEYQYLIGEAHRRGHTIALHTATHDYSIYKSKDAYFKDLEQIKEVVRNQTGQEVTLLRFPGGSSNTVSKKHCEGIMSVLAKEVVNRGYRYCDWNVSSGDGSISSEQVLKNVIEGVSANRISIVLQHDSVKESVDAVDSIIQWGMENGYRFLPIVQDTALWHHSVQN